MATDLKSSTNVTAVPAFGLSVAVPRTTVERWGRKGTGRYYDACAQDYADATRALPLHPSFERFVQRLERRAAVLDLGCGAGRDLRALSNRGFRAMGIEASTPLAELCAEFSGSPVIIGDLRATRLESETFSGVWASASLLHLRRSEIPAALAEVLRLLRHGGYFFSSVKTGLGEGSDARGRWISYFQPQEWLSLMRSAGFTVIESNSSSQAAGTLGKQGAEAWFDCTVQKA